jgi:aconitate hydratase A / 2-methylisocitrate dehydratase
MSHHDPLGIADPFPDSPTPATIYRLDKLENFDRERFSRRPLTIRLLAENLARNFARAKSPKKLLNALVRGEPLAGLGDVPFFPGRVLLQDFTGVPVLVDLTALRSAAVARGLPPERVNPTVPVDLVVDHSVQVDSYGTTGSLKINLDREYERNGERYVLLRWAKQAYANVRVVPPGNGIVHQVNLEYLASVVAHRTGPTGAEVYPDTVVGTDSHTTMVNGLGVLAWGVGGIEAEAVMMGEPYYLTTPTIVGVRLTGALPEGATATDVVLTVTRRLREHGVVEKFVEFFGPGVAHLAVADRATLSNMCPEYGATAAMFPIDEATLTYLARTGRTPAEVDRVRRYAHLQGLWDTGALAHIDYDELVEVDLGKIVPTVSGPKNPEESVPLSKASESFRSALAEYRSGHPVRAAPTGTDTPVQDGKVVIAAITSCTNTSNPAVMIGAGLIAERAVQLGLRVPAGVKTSLAPGSKVVTDYLRAAGLLVPLATLGFDVVGYGCTTCIGNSGPLDPAVERQVKENDLFVGAVLSGNRNFEARIHNLVRANYLASPMLVVAYALAGRLDIDLTKDPLGTDRDGHPVLLKDLWPKSDEIRRRVETSLDPEMFRKEYREITVGDQNWEQLSVPDGSTYPWAASSTYLRNPPYFDGSSANAPSGPVWLKDARALVVLGDRVSTDHISPAGEIPVQGPAGEYLIAHDVDQKEFNTFGARRGNHDVMVRGTFANPRLKNQLVAPREGGLTQHLPDGAVLPIYEAAEIYRRESVPLVVLAGASYGQGSSRDWAAKGPLLLGVRAVIAESYERIHRSNLVGMGVVPFEFAPGEGWKKLGLSGRERFTFQLPSSGLAPHCEVEVSAADESGQETRRFRVRCRIDSETEMEYYRSGGLLPFVLNQLAA